MARKPVKTIHFLAVADSMKVQNEAAMALVQTVQSVISVLETDARTATVHALIEKLTEANNKFTSAMWPEDA